MTLPIIVMMMSYSTVQSAACKSRGATTARLPLLLVLLAASCRQPQSLPVLAAATSPTLTTHQLVPTTTTLSKKKNLITIGHKFQSAAIATHNSILQKAKQEEEEVDGDDDTRRSKKGDGEDRLPTGDPTYEPTSWYPTYYPTPSAIDGGADVEEGSEATQVPTREPTTPNTTYDPTSSIDGGASLVTNAPTKPSISITHEQTAAWNGNGFPSQGNTLKDEEAEVNTTTSPTAQPSSTIPTPYKTSFLTPTPTLTTIVPTTGSAKPVENEAYESHVITLVPSEVPSEAEATPSPSDATSSVPSAVSDDQDCPKLFDESAFYVEGDVISTQGPLYCRSKGCRIIYKCSSPTFCNVVVPGKDYSEQGWVKVGNCGRLPMEEEQPTAASDVPSSFPTLQDQVAVPHHDVEESHLEDEATSRPTSHPTEWHFGFTPTSPTQSEHDNDSVQNSGLSVDLPRIICDISLDDSLTDKFEQEHILLVVMTKIIYDIFEMHLSKEMYDLTGVSLSVTTKKNLDGNGSDESNARLHAFFTGTASFSRSVPSQSDLIEVLLLHFSVEDFQHRLNFPLRLRTFDDPVKVNSVFFTLEDGSLVNVGYKNEQEEFALPAVASDEREEASLSAHQVQIITIAITMVAMPFALAAIFLIVLKNMDEEEEVEYQEADDEASSNESPPEDEEEVLPSAPAAPVPVVDTNESAAAAAKVEINIPSTPSSAMMPLSDISESQSEWSSISDSFHYTMELESPAKVGLGISAAGRHHYHQKGTPYVDQAAPFGLVSELWEHNDHLEVYEDYIIDV